MSYELPKVSWDPPRRLAAPDPVVSPPTTELPVILAAQHGRHEAAQGVLAEQHTEAVRSLQEIGGEPFWSALDEHQRDEITAGALRFTEREEQVLHHAGEILAHLGPDATVSYLQAACVA